MLVPEAFARLPTAAVCEVGTAAMTVADTLGRPMVAEAAPASSSTTLLKRALATRFIAVRRHQRHNPSRRRQRRSHCHVDFATLAARRAGGAPFRPVPQGPSLQRLGIASPRPAAAGCGARPSARYACSAALIDPAEWHLFKVLCIAAPGLPAPGGVLIGAAHRPGDR